MSSTLAISRSADMAADGAAFMSQSVSTAKPLSVVSDSPTSEFPSVEQLVREEAKGPTRWKEMLSRPPFYIAKLRPSCSIDSMTRRWIRNAADERAAAEGYRFDESRGMHAVRWVSTYCYLYEGDKAGYPMDIDDWQYEWFMQVYGWVKWSDDWGRWIRRFRQASAWIPKKNAKSPTLAANGLYLLCGDGELGQKCYSIARDAKQGLIAHTHAMEMVRASEELSRECTISMTTYTITHQPTRSKYLLVSSENYRSTEGFNGSLLVDEVHVVDHKIMQRVKRATISRSEPLHIEMSTAGDNGDGYGANRYKYCRRLLSGEIYDPSFYVLDFSVDQNMPLESLYDEKIVLRLGQECNPSMGRIIKAEEFRSDWLSSVHSQTELAQFAMYRLNKWLSADANWIAYADWLACGRQYTLDDLREYPCYAGLDLSKTRDMTSLVLVFAVDDPEIGMRPHVYPFFWLPTETAKLYSNNIDFHQAAFKGLINFCEGKVIDYEMIADRLNWCVENLDFRCVGYDPYNSNILMDILYHEYGWSEDMFVKVKQNMATMGPATGDVKRLILAKELAHNNNAVLNWQMSHCRVQTDRNGNEKPIKPSQDDYRKVDGVVAMIMGVAMLLADDSAMADYKGRDSILLYPRDDAKDER